MWHSITPVLRMCCTIDSPYPTSIHLFRSTCIYRDSCSFNNCTTLKLCTFYPNIWIACFIILSEEWVIVFLTQMSNFSVILRREQVTFDEEIMRPTLLVSFLNVVLAHWNNNPWVDMLLHFDKVSQFRVNQSLLFLLNDAWNKYHLTVFGLARPGHSRRAR